VHDGVRYVAGPVRAIRALEKETVTNLEAAELVCWLFAVAVGLKPNPLIAKRDFRLGDIANLPRRLPARAREFLEWAKGHRLILNEVLVARNNVEKNMMRLRSETGFGKRRLSIVASLRSECAAVPVSEVESTAPLKCLDILPDEIGLPLSSRTLRKVRAFAPARIEVLDYQGPFSYAGNRLVRIRLMEDGFSIQGITLTLPVENAPQATTIHGVLEDFFETGSEGIHWAVVDDDDESYDGLHFIKAGDYLTILGSDEGVLWKGIIACDRKSGFQKYPQNPEYGQPQALGYWIHWTQKGFKPDDWARFFIRPDGRRLRAILEKGPVAGKERVKS